jgi:RHS repeat-associated protein
VQLLTNYVYDVNRGLPVVLEETVGSSTRRFVWGLSLAHMVENSGATLVYHVDGVGSARSITDSTKAVVQAYETDEFGVPITASGGSAQPFSFTGEQRDTEASLIYLRARTYDPLVGRFLQRDRFAGILGSAQTLNRYGYVQNNPATLRDPSGLISQAGQMVPPGCLPPVFGRMICLPSMSPPQQTQIPANSCPLRARNMLSGFIDSYRLQYRTPATDGGPQQNCHVNVQIPMAGSSNSYINFHVYHSNGSFSAIDTGVWPGSLPVFGSDPVNVALGIAINIGARIAHQLQRPLSFSEESVLTNLAAGVAVALEELRRVSP